MKSKIKFLGFERKLNLHFLKYRVSDKRFYLGM